MCVSVSGPADRPRGAERCNGQRECRRRARAWIRDAVPATPRAEREAGPDGVHGRAAGKFRFLESSYTNGPSEPRCWMPDSRLRFSASADEKIYTVCSRYLFGDPPQ